MVCKLLLACFLHSVSTPTKGRLLRAAVYVGQAANMALFVGGWWCIGLFCMLGYHPYANVLQICVSVYVGQAAKHGAVCRWVIMCCLLVQNMLHLCSYWVHQLLHSCMSYVCV